MPGYSSTYTSTYSMPAVADSLVIADLIETMGTLGGPTPSQIPELVNSSGVAASFRILAPASDNSAGLGYTMSYDLSAPQPTTDIVQSMLLDGERPFGYRASNRTITLPILIQAGDQNTLTAAREILMQLIDQQTWTLTWTPGASGLPLVFDCFRALPTVVTYGFMYNQAFASIYTLSFQAMPYGRSDPSGLQQVAFSSPLLGGVSAPPAAVTLDAFTSVSGTHWSRSTTKYVAGSASARYTPTAWPQYAATYTKTGLSVNITGLTALSVWFGQSYDTAHFGPWPGMASNVTLAWTLTDASSNTLTFHKTYNKCRWSNSAANPAWTRISAAIPQTSASFLYTSVAGYSVTISNWMSGGVPFLARMNAWLNGITANPPSLAVPASTRGVVYNIMGTAGTARTPISSQFQLPQSGTVSQELEGSGLWWPPVGVTSVQAECVGAGGAGGNQTTAGLGGGGGGAEYAAEPSLTVAAGTPVPYTCGTGGQPGATQQVVTYTQPGTASWVCPVGVTTIKAECWGAGAGGAPGSGGGGGGSYGCEPSLAVTPGVTYALYIGSGGSGGGTAAAGGTVTQRNGLASTIIGDSVTVTGNGGKTGLTGGTTGGAGGTASGNTTVHAGGAGGTAPAGGGGGGGGSGGSAASGNTGSAGSGNTGGAGGAAVTGGGAGGAGAPNPGWPGAGVAPGGGGGGGFSSSYNGGGGNGATGQCQITYTVAAGSQVNGSSTTFGSTLSSGTVVTAHGGASVAPNTATGGAGGSGSSNTTHHSGGAGFTATGSAGGGGGSSGGSASAGTAATSATGAAAVTGGGKGANAGSGNDTSGSSAAPPGGGGGGSDMATTAQTGGQGGNGNITVTWTPPLAPFGTLIAHRPSLTAPDSLNPCVPVANTNDSPVGIQYTVPSLIPGVNALFGGTYSVVLVNYNWDSPTVTRIISVTVTQYEYIGGPSYPVVLSRSLTPSTDIVNGICLMGELTLPIKDIDPSNTSAYFTVSITDTDVSDQFLDVLFLDVQGETVIINIPPGDTYSNFFIDEPTADRDLGRVLGSDLDRSQAISVLDSAICSGGPFYINPGDNTFLAYSPAGAPNLGASYLPRWYTDRLA